MHTLFKMAVMQNSCEGECEYRAIVSKGTATLCVRVSVTAPQVVCGINTTVLRLMQFLGYFIFFCKISKNNTWHSLQSIRFIDIFMVENIQRGPNLPEFISYFFHLYSW